MSLPTADSKYNHAVIHKTSDNKVAVREWKFS